MNDLLLNPSFWSYVLTFCFQAFIAWIVWSFNNRFASKDEHDKLKGRIQKVEDDLTRLPDIKAVHKLSIQMTRLEGELKSVYTRFEGFSELSSRMQRQMDLMDHYLKKEHK